MEDRTGIEDVWRSIPDDLLRDIKREWREIITIQLIKQGWVSPEELAKEKFKAGCEGRQEGESAMVAKFQGWKSPEQVQEIFHKLDNITFVIKIGNIEAFSIKLFGIHEYQSLKSQWEESK